MRPQQQMILLKEGTEDVRGISQIISNINACQHVAEAVKTTLGPRGMDKLIVNEEGNVTISNDGAIIMKQLNVVHPAAKILVDIAKSQDAEVGDGTTTVVLLAATFLSQVKSLIEEGIHPRVIIQSFKKATDYAVKKIQTLSVKIDQSSTYRRTLLEKCAATALNSKLIHQQKYFFARLVVDAVFSLDKDVLLPLNMIGIKKVGGGALEHSMLIQGVAFKKTFTYAGCEMQPKSCSGSKIAILNVDLEMKAERENAEIRVDSISEYQKVIDAEWGILYSKLEMICKSGARIVLSKLPIGDVATQYFADRKIFCAGRVSDEDLNRMVKACGGCITCTVHDLSDEVLGQCEQFEEKQIGAERYNIFTGCQNAKACTIILRGGTEQFLEETERSLHDAIMITRKMMLNNDSVVAGGGAIEMELSRLLRDYSRTIERKQHLVISAFAKALEIIPRQLADNAGFEAVNIMNRMRQKHEEGCTWHGVDIDAEDVSDNFERCVWEPAMMKINSLTAAAEAACLVLSVDETIKNVSSLSKAPGRGLGHPF